jgi:hypothetical protein
MMPGALGLTGDRALGALQRRRALAEFEQNAGPAVMERPRPRIERDGAIEARQRCAAIATALREAPEQVMRVGGAGVARQRGFVQSARRGGAARAMLRQPGGEKFGDIRHWKFTVPRFAARCHRRNAEVAQRTLRDRRAPV